MTYGNPVLHGKKKDYLNIILGQGGGVDFCACLLSPFSLLWGKKQHRNIFSHHTGRLAKFGWILTYLKTSVEMRVTWLLPGAIQLDIILFNFPSSYPSLCCLGGLEAFSCYVAEDYFISKAIWKRCACTQSQYWILDKSRFLGTYPSTCPPGLTLTLDLTQGGEACPQTLGLIQNLFVSPKVDISTFNIFLLSEVWRWLSALSLQFRIPVTIHFSVSS